tara:strand:- start:3385 stop:7056 length:3672 start_codon:yes stop_codon:yes gene_type:complete
MAANYQNHLYLFNSDQLLKSDDLSGKALKSWKDTVSAEITAVTIANVAAALNDTGNSYEPLYKTAAAAQAPSEELLAGAFSAETTPRIYADEYYAGKIYTHTHTNGVWFQTLTNDPAQNPWKTHIFESPIPTDSPKTRNYKFGNPAGRTNWGEQSYRFIPMIDKEQIKLGVPSKQDYENFNIIPPQKPTQDSEEPYLFHQTITREAVGWKSFNGTKTGYVYELDTIFNKFYNKIAGQVINGVYYTYKTMDISTKIGIPYDFQTIIKDGINTKAIGVDTKQPTYDKIYNYYDGQYEPVVISAIENNTLDERLLPSIYDFLYKEQQPSVRTFLKIPGFSLAETNLGAINQYLDNYGQAFASTFDGEEITLVDKFDLEDLEKTKLNLQLPNLSVEDLGWVNPNLPIIHPTALLKYQFNIKKAGLSALSFLELEDQMETVKSEGKPTWLGEIKRGIYFSERQIETFNETMDKSEIFPFLARINIPMETVGPIANLLSQYRLLDNINAYAASNTVPIKESPNTHASYFGAVINGVDNNNFNTLHDLKLPSFKIYFKKAPAPPLSKQDVYNLGSPILSVTTPAAGQTDPISGLPVEESGPVGIPVSDLPTPPKEFSQMEIFVSWLRKQIDGFVATHFTNPDPTQPGKSPAGHKILYKIHPSGPERKLAPAYGVKVEIWSYCEPFKGSINEENPYQGCEENFVNGLDGPIWIADWTENAYNVEKSFIDSDQALYSLANVLSFDVLDLTGTEVFPEIITPSTADFGVSDLFIDDLTTSIQPEVFVYGIKDEPASENSNIAALIEKLKIASFKNRLLDLLIDGHMMRSPAEIHEGKLAHEETLMYEIAKYSVGKNGKERYIQSIFLPITHKNQLSYYDTQVIPFKDYFYKIFAHKAIVGTEYKPTHFVEPSSLGTKAIIPVMVPENPKTTSKSPLFIKMNYELRPYIEIVRVPYYNTKSVNLAVDKLNYSRIEDAPPLPPQVNIVPYRTIDNRILILLNGSIGEVEEYPRPLFPFEMENVINVSLSQDRLPGDKLLYKSDDSQGIFEILRWSDILPEDNQMLGNIMFNPNARASLRSLEFVEPTLEDSLIDSIQPNRDYYYIFRFTDIHGKFSNPTDIYKVKMVHTPDSQPYLLLELIDIKTLQKNNYDSKFSVNKKMQKYLYIQPNFTQNTLTVPENVDNMNYASVPVSLGDPSGTSVFGKKFKLRITSKNTGRKIDINMTVKDPEIIINE